MDVSYLFRLDPTIIYTNTNRLVIRTNASVEYQHNTLLRLINNNFPSMEFTQIQYLDTLIGEYRQEHRHRSTLKAIDQPSPSLGNTEASRVIHEALSIRVTSIHVAKQLEEIAMSYYSNIEEITPEESPLVEFERGKAKSDLTTANNFEFGASKLTFRRNKISDLTQTRMSTLNGRLSTIFSEKKSPYKKRLSRVRVYFFGTKQYKTLEYDNETLVEGVIKKALASYLEDPTLDSSVIKTTAKEAYTLMMCDYEPHIADEEMEPLNPKKNMVELNADNLVLVKDYNQQNAEPGELMAEYVTVHTNDRKSIMVVSEMGEELLKMNMNNDNVAALIYEKLEKMDAKYQGNNKFYITGAEGEEGEISRDAMVNDIPNIVYVRLVKYADEAVLAEARKPSEDAEGQDIEAPMNMGQASMYQQFSVIKINKRGVRQDRILGIDQIKIYNYDREIRKEDKQVNFLSKIFSNVSLQFGTKTPQRLISDIVSVTQVPEKRLLVIHFSNVFASKSLEFEIEPKVRRRIAEKLRVLMQYQQGRTK